MAKALTRFQGSYHNNDLQSLMSSYLHRQLVTPGSTGLIYQYLLPSMMWKAGG